MLKNLGKSLGKIPVWLRIVGGTLLFVVVCGALTYLVFAVLGLLLWASLGASAPCVDGQPGSPAIFRNGGTQLFIFPQSASEIQSDCTTWQSASINVWFEMAPNDLDSFVDSMRWNVRPLTPTNELPTFGHPKRHGTYLYGEYSNYPEGTEVWIDTSSTPYRVFVYVWLD